MARLAVLLLLATAVALALADTPSAEALKYKEHDKHHDKEHKDYGPPHDMDGYKKHEMKYEKYDSYKPDSYKEYKPEGYKSGYGGYYEHDHYGQKPYDPHTKPYEHYGGEHSYGYAPEGYGYGYVEESPYDGGYWGGMNGHQIIHLQTRYPEALTNTTLIDRRRRREMPDNLCVTGQPGTCDQDFAVLCGKRHYDASKYSYGSDYAARSHGPIFQTPPVQPIAIAKGWVAFEFDAQGEPLLSINEVHFNKHQTGYKIADVNGYIDFAEGGEACHPLLGKDTVVEFNAHRVPIYLIFGKVNLPVNPAILFPLGGVFIEDRKAAKAGIQAAKETDEYKTTDKGSQYKVEGDHIYVKSKKDSTICGLAAVARGPVTLTAPIPETMPVETQLYTGTIEWPIVWTDLITTLPLLIRDDPTTRSVTGFDLGAFLGPIVAEVVGIYLTETIDRVAAVCEANSDIPWINPGSITLDVRPTMA